MDTLALFLPNFMEDEKTAINFYEGAAQAPKLGWLSNPLFRKRVGYATITPYEQIQEKKNLL
jgi:hypothetical protein